MISRTNRWAILFSIIAGTLWLSPAAATRVVVDKVVAVVEDDAIFQSDIEQTLKQFMVQRGMTSLPPGERATIEKQALDELVNAKLVLAKAKRLGIDVSFEEVEQAVDRALQENMQTLGGEAAFNRQLESEKLTLDELRRLYREQLRNRMLVDRVLAREISRGSLQITDEDLLEAYKKRKTDLPRRPAVVHLRSIYLALESSQNAKSEARARIEELYRRIDDGEDFGKIAEEFSEDPSSKNGGSLGEVKLADLSDRRFADAAAILSTGEVSQPVLTSYGFHLIQVTGVDSIADKVTLRHILVRIKPGDEDIQVVFAKANEIHQLLSDGAPFDSTAIRYSDDEATAADGGDLGWLRIKDLPEFFQEVLQTMEPGDISQVLREPTGFRIVNLIGREAERPFEYAEVKDEIRKLVEKEKMTNAYDTYLAGLRSEFYVEMHD